METEPEGGSTATVVDETNRTVKRLHPVRGLFWGLVFGLGLAGVLIVTTTITVSVVGVIAVLAVGLVLGVLWGAFGPAKQPKGPPPPTQVIVEQAPSTRFDDFTAPADSAPDGAERST